MTTRRDVLTGLAAMPIATATGNTAEASPIAPMPPPGEAPAPAAPAFMHDIDQAVFQELDWMEQAIGRAKTELLAANNADPIIRSGLLFLMRCNTDTLFREVDWLRLQIDNQRITADLVAKAEKIRRDAEAAPKISDLLKPDQRAS